MKSFRLVTLFAGVLAALASSFATAQSIQFAITAVPTLTEWGGILLALLLAAASFYQFRKSGGKAGGLFLLTLTAGLASFAYNPQVIGEARATPPLVFDATSTTVDLSAAVPSPSFGNSYRVEVRNATTTPMTIAALVNGDRNNSCNGGEWQISLTPPASTKDPKIISTPFCTVGSTLQVTQQCYVYLNCQGNFPA